MARNRNADNDQDAGSVLTVDNLTVAEPTVAEPTVAEPTVAEPTVADAKDGDQDAPAFPAGTVLTDAYGAALAARDAVTGTVPKGPLAALRSAFKDADPATRDGILVAARDAAASAAMADGDMPGVIAAASVETAARPASGIAAPAVKVAAVPADPADVLRATLANLSGAASWAVLAALADGMDEDAVGMVLGSWASDQDGFAAYADADIAVRVAKVAAPKRKRASGSGSSGGSGIRSPKGSTLAKVAAWAKDAEPGTYGYRDIAAAVGASPGNVQNVLTPRGTGAGQLDNLTDLMRVETASTTDAGMVTSVSVSD